jgi:hypothetical protein
MELHTRSALILARRSSIWFGSTWVAGARSNAALHGEPEGKTDWHGSLWRVTFSWTGIARQDHEVRLIPAQYEDQ